MALLRERRAADFLKALMTQVAPDARAQVFRAPPEEQLGLLSKHLPNELNDRFVGTRWDLPPRATRSEALSAYTAFKKAEDEFDRMVESAARQAVPRTRELNLLHLADPDSLDAVLGHLEQSSQMRVPAKNRAVIEAVKKAQRRAATFASRVVARTESPARPIRLIEVPPVLGIFRGCVGGDCSTQYSFPFPNDPDERVFFIEDPESGAIKGYITGTLVDTDQGPAFYTITANGPGLSTSDTINALQGLNLHLEELGAKHLLLPPQSLHKGLLNFPSVRAAYGQSVGPGSIGIRYRNPAIRRILEQNGSDYDSMDQNKIGQFFQPPPTSPPETVLALQPIPRANSRPPTRTDLVGLALDLREGGFSREATQVLKKAQTPGTSSVLFESLHNRQEHPIDLYESAIRKHLADLQVDPAIVFEERRHLLDQGRLAAPDAFLPEKLTDTVESLFRLLESEPDIGQQKMDRVLQTNARLLEANAAVRVRLNSLVQDESNALRVFGRLIAYIPDAVEPGTLAKLGSIGWDGSAGGNEHARRLLGIFHTPSAMNAMLDAFERTAGPDREQLLKMIMNEAFYWNPVDLQLPVLARAERWLSSDTGVAPELVHAALDIFNMNWVKSASVPINEVLRIAETGDGKARREALPALYKGAPGHTELPKLVLAGLHDNDVMPAALSVASMVDFNNSEITARLLAIWKIEGYYKTATRALRTQQLGEKEWLHLINFLSGDSDLAYSVKDIFMNGTPRPHGHRIVAALESLRASGHSTLEPGVLEIVIDLVKDSTALRMRNCLYGKMPKP
ncbi:MAG: hypothetical protein AAB425_08110 [Bdellovibrionota bacterium]